MDPDAHLAALSADSAALARVAEGHLDRPVASCPGWTVARLVAHVGGLYGWVGAIVRAAGAPPEQDRDPAPDDPAALVGWFRSQRDAVLAALAEPPDQAAWTFAAAGPRNVAWWRRRQAMETAVHLFDAGDAAGEPPTIEPELAADGIDEFLSVILPRVLSRQPVPALRGTFHLHATDTPGEWSLDFGAADLSVRREHTKADTAARGPAAGLFLWLWNRLDPDRAGLEVFGDGSLVGAWPDVRP